VFFTFVHLDTEGQRWKFWKKKHFPTFDSTYVHKFPKNLSIEFTGTSDFNSMMIRSKSNEKKYLEYHPATPVNIGLKLDYSWLGVSLGLTNFNKDQTEYGKTQKFDLTFYIYGRWMVSDLIFRRYKGFYADNPDDSRFADKHPKFPGLTHTFLNINMMYLFNSKKYSAKAAFTQNEIQLKSSGSPLFGIYLAYHNLIAPKVFLTEDYQSQFQSAGRFNHNLVSVTGFQVGYAHTFVILQDFKLAFLFNPVFGFELYYLRNTLNKDKYFGVEGIVKWNYRLSFVYDKTWFYTGAMFLKDDSFFAKGKKSLQEYYQIQSGFIKVFFGFRLFRLPKFTTKKTYSQTK
jgi:hypothetical protein